MNTFRRKHSALLSFCTVALLFSACATTRTESLQTSASKLDAASSQFATQVRYQGDDTKRGRVSRDAEAMAKSAHNLSLSVGKGDTRAKVEDEYRRVTDSYGLLHSQLAEEGYAAQDRRVLEDFDRVTTTYRNVEAAMGRRIADAR
jgi:hypothetical protein